MIDSYKARQILADCLIYRESTGHFPDYHALNSDRVLALTEEAQERRYRKPRQANGSRARCFYQYLTRAAEKAD